MNLPNKLTISRILMIPLLNLILMIPFDLGFVKLCDTKILITHLLASIIFLIASLTDWLDGKIARKQRLITTFGKFADPLADKILVLNTFILLVEMEKVSGWIVAIILWRELSVTSLRLLCLEQGEIISATWTGKLKTVTQVIAILLLLTNNVPFDIIKIPVDQIMLYTCLIFTIHSGIDYFIKNRRFFKSLL